MIRITRKALFEKPVVLQTTGHAARNLLEQAYNEGIRDFIFDKHIYAAAEVKETLIAVQNYKCCFCESKIGHIDDGDVEHFRPKAAYKQEDGTSPVSPGYYWLAYDWDNLFLACTKCNQRNKGSLFPLLTPTTRAISHHNNIHTEDPVFIHPEREDPSLHITFQDENIFPCNQSERGRITIRSLKLDRSELTQHRAESLSGIKALYEIVALIPDEPTGIKQEALEILRGQLSDKTAETHQYAGMFRVFFLENPLPSLT